MAKKIVYVDMDNVLVDFPSAFASVDPRLLEAYKGDEDEIPHIFSKMEPVKGAIEAFTYLSEHFDTYILSTAPWENPTAWSEKLEWVKEHLGKVAYKRLILTHHKNLNVGDFLIDDRPNNGAEDFTGELIRFGGDEFPDWDSVSHLYEKAYWINVQKKSIWTPLRTIDIHVDSQGNRTYF